MFAYRRQNERHILNNKIHTAFRGSYGGTRNTMSSYSCATVHSAQCTLIMNCIYLSVQLNIRVVIKRIVDRAVYTFQSIATLPHLPHDELKIRRSVAGHQSSDCLHQFAGDVRYGVRPMNAYGQRHFCFYCSHLNETEFSNYSHVFFNYK